jgi:hypothetical protein
VNKSTTQCSATLSKEDLDPPPAGLTGSSGTARCSRPRASSQKRESRPCCFGKDYRGHCQALTVGLAKLPACNMRSNLPAGSQHGPVRSQRRHGSQRGPSVWQGASYRVVAHVPANAVSATCGRKRALRCTLSSVQIPERPALKNKQRRNTVIQLHTHREDKLTSSLHPAGNSPVAALFAIALRAGSALHVVRGG